jgi:hypothetical protein
MLIRTRTSFALCLALAVGMFAAPQPLKAQTPPRMARGAIRIVVHNGRDATLMDLAVSPANAPGMQPQMIARGVQPGERIDALVRGGGCLYRVSGNFADQSQVEQPSVDLCTHRTLRFVP